MMESYWIVFNMYFTIELSSKNCRPVRVYLPPNPLFSPCVSCLFPCWHWSPGRKSANTKKEDDDDDEEESKVRVKADEDDDDSDDQGKSKRDEHDDLVRKVRFNLENHGCFNKSKVFKIVSTYAVMFASP